MIAARDFHKALSIRAPSRSPASAAIDPDTLTRQWRAIYALCRPEELHEEDARLKRERDTLRETHDQRARKLNRLRRSVLRERLAELGER